MLEISYFTKTSSLLKIESWKLNCSLLVSLKLISFFFAEGDKNT